MHKKILVKPISEELYNYECGGQNSGNCGNCTNCVAGCAG